VRSGATALLAGAISYAIGACALIAPGEMSLPTPCTEWDLGTLLGHLSVSMADLEEAIGTGRLGVPQPGPPSGPGDPVEGIRDRAAELLWACYRSTADFVVVGGLPVSSGIVACTGAVEIAVHGWDVSAARGRDCPIPAALATRMLELCPLLLAGRDGLFALPVQVPAQARPGDRLVGYLGRNPGTCPRGQVLLPGSSISRESRISLGGG
jgi:uncharacterized protein (TIGR03086 family)